jgi:hypothetical protein
MATYNKTGFGFKYFNIVKNVLAVLFGLFALAVIVSFFLDPSYKIERKINANADLETVEMLVIEPENWKKWSVWSEEKDSTVTFSYDGPKSGKGAIMTFEGELLGDGSLKIDNYKEYSIDYNMSFADDAFRFYGEIFFVPSGKFTEITWIVRGDVGWNPFAKFFKSTLKDLIAQDIEANLQKLKKYAETK